VSDVAIWKRLKAAGSWLRWMAEGVMKRWIPHDNWDMPGPGLRLRAIDGSTVQEPGAKGISWRMHYSVELPSLMCTEVHLTRVNVGESFKRLKSLLKLGHLRKKDTESARAWIQAKLLLAFLTDAIRRAASDFFPRGHSPAKRG
jgi:hypothetical protein